MKAITKSYIAEFIGTAILVIGGVGTAVLAGTEVGFLGMIGSIGAPGPFSTALREGLGETGYVEGRNVTFEDRWAEGNYDRLPALAADLVARKVDVIVAVAVPARHLRRNVQPRRSRLSSQASAIRWCWASSPVWPGRAATSRASATSP